MAAAGNVRDLGPTAPRCGNSTTNQAGSPDPLKGIFPPSFSGFSRNLHPAFGRRSIFPRFSPSEPANFAARNGVLILSAIGRGIFGRLVRCGVLHTGRCRSVQIAGSAFRSFGHDLSVTQALLERTSQAIQSDPLPAANACPGTPLGTGCFPFIGNFCTFRIKWGNVPPNVVFPDPAHRGAGRVESP